MTYSACQPDRQEKELGAAVRRSHHMTDDLIPAPEHQPPYSEDFIAHLHAGAYENRQDHDQLWRAVRADPDANYILLALSKVTDALRVAATVACPPLKLFAAQ